MNTIYLSFVVVTVLSWPVWGQKVEVQKPDRGQIIHVETSLNHLTILELSEPVATVAVGSSAFKVEWRENRVLIEPTDINVATNLFVWTASGRFNYELDPPGGVPQMDFAIDQPASDPPRPAKTVAQPADPSPAEILMAAKPVHVYGSAPEKNRVGVYLTALLEYDGQIFVRYTIRNGTKRAYVPGSPQVTVLDSPRSRQSLYSLADSQLSSDVVGRLKSASETPVGVAQEEMRSPRVEPGQETTGVVAIKLSPEHAGPAILRLTFLAGPNGAVNATLVL